MSFNVVAINLINDLKIILKFGGPDSDPSSGGNPFRPFVSLGLFVCLILVVLGFGIAGAMSGSENVPRLIERVYTGLVGTGIGMAIPLGIVFVLMGGTRNQSANDQEDER